MEVIGESDAYGQTPIDGIWRGGEVTNEFLSLASKAGSLAPFWPYGANVAGPGVIGGLYNPAASVALPIGVLASDIAKAHVLTSIAGTPAASGVPAPSSLTATKALLKESYPAPLLFNSKLRKVPIMLRYWPYDAGSGFIKFFATA